MIMFHWEVLWEIPFPGHKKCTVERSPASLRTSELDLLCFRMTAEVFIKDQGSWSLWGLQFPLDFRIEVNAHNHRKLNRCNCNR